MQTAEAAENALQRVAAAFEHRFRPHLVNAVLQNAAHRLIYQLLAVGAHLVDGFIVEGQAIAAALNDAVHLFFQLRVQLGQTTVHTAIGADLFGNDFIQRLAAFFDSRTRAFVNPRQAATQTGLVILRLFALGGAERISLAVKGQVAVRFDHQIAVFPFHLYLLRGEDHIVTRRDATLVVRMGRQSGDGERHRQQRFTHHKTPLRQNGPAVADPCQT